MNGVKHTYSLSGSTIVAEEWTESGINHTILYLYDAKGTPIGMRYTNSSKGGFFDNYLYVTNLQGDIIHVYNDKGERLITYNYDAWGNHSVSYANDGDSTTATYNPFRYRGYYYDVETGFYYLNSRYYDPQVGRFINADTYASTGQGLLGNNMFAYCGNNPVSRLDSTGHAFAQACFDQNSLLTMLCPLLWGGSGGGVSSGYSIATSGSSFKIPQLAHTDPQEVQRCLQENGIAFYHGCPVIYADLLGDGSAFSYGTIVLDVYLENAEAEEFAETLNHEYGHAVHLGQIGLLAYTATVAIPSLTCAGLTSVCPWLAENYFSLPWERIADYLGGVDRGGYLSGAANVASAYWLYSEAFSILLGG